MAEGDVTQIPPTSEINAAQARIGELEEANQRITEAARAYVGSSQLVHNVIREAVAARDIFEFIAAVKHSCEEEFGIEDARFVFALKGAEPMRTVPGVGYARHAVVDRYFPTNYENPVITRKIRKSLANEPAKFVNKGSEAVLRIELETEMTSNGILVLSSTDPNHFPDDQATDLLAFMGEVISSQLGLWLRL